MIIENSDEFYNWLTVSLGRLCDADPAALAKYVMALVKKDKGENELKCFCTDQLEIFLSKQTKAFVDLLFETLRTKSYLANVNSASSQTRVLAENESNERMFNGTVSATVRGTLPTVIDKIEKDKIHTQDFDIDIIDIKDSRSSSNWSSSSSESSRKNEDNRIRETEDQALKLIMEYENQKRQEKLLRRTLLQQRERICENNQLIKSSERDRDKEMRPSREQSAVRQWSHSPRSRSRSHNHSRSRSRSASTVSNSSSEERGLPTVKEDNSSRFNKNNLDHQADHGDTDYRVGVVAPETTHSSTHSSLSRAGTDPTKKKPSGEVARRCKDYDEKGFCMRGELCLFDHGTDPLVLNFGSQQADKPFGVKTTAQSNSCVIPQIIIPHQSADNESSHPPLPPSPPPPPPLPATQGTFTPEPYNPEAPGIYGGKQEQTERVCVPGHTPTPCSSVVTPMVAAVLPFNPNEPPPGFHNSLKVQRARELIGVPTSGLDVIEPANSTADELCSQMALTKKQSSAPVTLYIGANSEGAKKRLFDFNRLGGKKMKKGSDRCTLELRKIPRHLNAITQLDKHFSKFGPIKSIQTCLGGDPEAAIVEFLDHEYATAAYRSSEAVLNNRFIKVFYHYKDNAAIVASSSNNYKGANNCKDEAASIATDDHTGMQEKSQCVDPSNMISNNIGLTGVPDPETAVLFSRKGNLTRTIFNPAAMKKSNVIPSVSSAVKKSKEDAIIMKKIELHKKKQSFLKMQIDNQKMLVDKLNKSKTEKDKEFLKKTLDDIKEKIASLQQELRKEYEEISAIMKSTNGKLSGNKVETVKDLLDAELDLYNKQHKGAEVAMTHCKMSELKHQTNNERDVNSNRGKGFYRPRLLAGRGRSRGTYHSVDHRTRRLLVLNPAGLDKDVLKKHFSQFGEIEHFQVLESNVYVAYETRKAAEVAYMYCNNKKSGLSSLAQTLKASWSYEKCPSEVSEIMGLWKIGEKEAFPDQVGEEEEEEEEEEDSESRSWRR